MNQHQQLGTFFVLVVMAGSTLVASRDGQCQERAARESVTRKSVDRETAAIKFGPRERVGWLHSTIIDESSGLAASLRYPGYYWTHNDNGTKPGLFLIDSDGEIHAYVRLANVPFRDWEAIDCTTIDERSYLTLADIGDNMAVHESCRIHIFPEPTLTLPNADRFAIELQIDQQATLEFTYPDGPQDCEAMAVEAESRCIFLISKRTDLKAEPTRLHQIPWQLQSTEKPLVATKLATALDYSMVTGMDFSPDGKLAVVRNYTAVRVYQRTESQTWNEAFAEPTSRTILPLQRQGEAVGFATDGKSILITSEGIRQPIWRLPLLMEDSDRKRP